LTQDPLAVNPDDGPEKWKEVEFKGEGNGVCVWGG